MLHIVLHLVVPVFVALAFYRRDWPRASVWLLSGLVVDIDHLLADPVYDPERCSIGLHPLHTPPAIVLYFALFAVPLVWRRGASPMSGRGALRRLHLVGLGLLVHMALDWTDCAPQRVAQDPLRSIHPERHPLLHAQSTPHGPRAREERQGREKESGGKRDTRFVGTHHVEDAAQRVE